MADYYFGLPGKLTLCFKTACKIEPESQIMLKLGAYVPGLKLLNKASSKPDLTVEHIKSDIPALEQTENHIKFYSIFGQDFPEDLYHLLYAVERKLLLEKGFYSVHAACAGEGNDYTLLIGHSGAGKTTLAQNMIDKHGMKLFSGNKTVVEFTPKDGIRAIAGTRTMTALDDRQARYAYEIEQTQYAPSEKVDIKRIVFLRVNEGVEEDEVLKPLSPLHSLYPFFMDAVNADIIVNGVNIFDGAATRESKEYLTEKLSKSLTHVPVRKISGSIDFMLERIMSPGLHS